MKSTLKGLGTVGGYAGTLVCLVSVGGRFFGSAHVFGWDASNVLLLGMALLLFACWSKLEAASA